MSEEAPGEGVDRDQRSDAGDQAERGEGIGGAVGETLSAARAAIGRAGQAIQQGRTARHRRLRQHARFPLPLLYLVHPEARRALPHRLGMRTIPLGEIAGTAVEPSQRGGDFLPLPDRRGVNWRGRWQRLRRAHNRLAILPPIDVVRFANRYWVVDGHNRVALGLYEDQVAIDADVTELHLPGQPVEGPSELAPLLEDSLEVRAAGRGRFARAGASDPVPDAPPGEASETTDSAS